MCEGSVSWDPKNLPCTCSPHCHICCLTYLHASPADVQRGAPRGDVMLPWSHTSKGEPGLQITGTLTPAHTFFFHLARLKSTLWNKD